MCVTRTSTDSEVEALRVYSEGETGVRLFVGWVPKHFGEDDLVELFKQFGGVKNVTVLRDRATGVSKGCAFVSLDDAEQASKAIDFLDRKVFLTGALRPLEVRVARDRQIEAPGEGPPDNKQLFFSQAPVSASVDHLNALFGAFGAVVSINVFQDKHTGLGKGCGIVTMMSHEEAVAAMEALDGKLSLEGGASALSVKWADPELQTRKKKAAEGGNADNRTLFFAKVLRTAGDDDVRLLFARFGDVQEVNLFRAFQGAPTTKGCGLVTMGSHREAQEAIDALDNRHLWDGMDSPVVVKWMDAALQRRRREQHLAAMRHGLIPSMGLGPDTWLPPGMALPGAASSSSSSSALSAGARLSASALGAGSAADPEVFEVPPAGCQPDAIKLFVGNIPKSYTEEQLRPFFETVGAVVELVIVRDKTSHESKGSAFVWYATRVMAERAILQFNLRHVLPDPTGEQDRPLVVRKAKSRAAGKAAQPMGLAAAAAAAGLASLDAALQQQQGGHMHLNHHHHHHASHMHHHSHAAALLDLAGSSHLPSGLTATLQLNGNGSAPGSYYAASTGGSGSGAGGGGGGLVDKASSGMLSLDGLSRQDSGLLSAGPSRTMSAGGPAGLGHFEGLTLGGGAATAAGLSMEGLTQLINLQALGAGHAAAASAQQQQHLVHDHITVSVQLNGAQLGAINAHLLSLQAMSGAAMHLTPGAPGTFYLLVSGPKASVEGANSLLTAVLNSSLGPL